MESLLSLRSEVFPRKSDTMLLYLSTRDPFSKINLWAITGPIIHVWLKICRNSSLLRFWVIIIKKSRNSLHNRVPLFTKKITTAVLIRSLNERWYLKIIYTLFLSFWILQRCYLRDLRPKKVAYARAIADVAVFH